MWLCCAAGVQLQQMAAQPQLTIHANRQTMSRDLAGSSEHFAEMIDLRGTSKPGDVSSSLISGQVFRFSTAWPGDATAAAAAPPLALAFAFRPLAS